MSVNWVTIAMVAIVAGSTLYGFIRGFAAESGSAVARVLYALCALIALWAAWVAGTYVQDTVLHMRLASVPAFLRNVVQAWQNAPGIGQAASVIALYVLFAGLLRPLVAWIPNRLVRFIPSILAQSRLLGGVVGVAVGGVRTIVYGALLFVLLQYLSIPAVASQANQSNVYGALSAGVYQPLLQPWMTKELPVLEQGAFNPVEKNINLFAVPTGQSGQEVGVLVIPKEIAAVAKDATKGAATPREKAYALYVWVAGHIHYDWQKYNDYVNGGHWDAQSPLDTLHTGKGVCADYALLYADMAHSVGLTVKIDEGLGGENGQQGSHAWNEVYDPNAKRWIPVDTTWGAEQAGWFDHSNFFATHTLQNSILIKGSGD